MAFGLSNLGLLFCSVLFDVAFEGSSCIAWHLILLSLVIDTLLESASSSPSGFNMAAYGRPRRLQRQDNDRDSDTSTKNINGDDHGAVAAGDNKEGPRESATDG
jgi:hypothetical protein